MLKHVLAVAVLIALLGGCQSGGSPGGEAGFADGGRGHGYFITGWGLGDMRRATAEAWADARRKLEMSGLRGYALVEAGTIRSPGTGETGIRFRLVPPGVSLDGRDALSNDLRRERQAVEMELDKLHNQGMGENHPRVKALRSEIDVIDKRIASRAADVRPSAPSPNAATNASRTEDAR